MDIAKFHKVVDLLLSEEFFHWLKREPRTRDGYTDNQRLVSSLRKKGAGTFSYKGVTLEIVIPRGRPFLIDGESFTLQVDAKDCLVLTPTKLTVKSWISFDLFEEDTVAAGKVLQFSEILKDRLESLSVTSLNELIDFNNLEGIIDFNNSEILKDRLESLSVTSLNELIDFNTLEGINESRQGESVERLNTFFKGTALVVQYIDAITDDLWSVHFLYEGVGLFFVSGSRTDDHADEIIYQNVQMRVCFIQERAAVENVSSEYCGVTLLKNG